MKYTEITFTITPDSETARDLVVIFHIAGFELDFVDETVSTPLGCSPFSTTSPCPM